MDRALEYIIITGASSGIGKALAIGYAAHAKHLWLFGRNKERLGEVATLCKMHPCKVSICAVDVTDNTLMESAIKEIFNQHTIDLLIANAGISVGSSSGDDEDHQTLRKIFSTNVDGVLNTTIPCIDSMKKQGYGQIAFMSSLAAFRGLPSAPAYSASKAAVKVYAEALHGTLSEHGIHVSVICPGYIKTPLTDKNRFYMPYLMPVEKAADIIMKGLEAKKSRIAFPMPIYFISWLGGVLPPCLTNWLYARLPRK